MKVASRFPLRESPRKAPSGQWAALAREEVPALGLTGNRPTFKLGHLRKQGRNGGCPALPRRGLCPPPDLGRVRY